MIFDIPVEPVAKGRPRVVTRHGKSLTYTPDRTVNAEERIKWHLRSLMKLDGRIPEHYPVSVTVDFFVKRPKKPKGSHPTTRPDLDQYVKLLLDACNGILWWDDSQVVHIEAQKLYSEHPRIRLCVEPMVPATSD